MYGTSRCAHGRRAVPNKQREESDVVHQCDGHGIVVARNHAVAQYRHHYDAAVNGKAQNITLRNPPPYNFSTNLNKNLHRSI